jgi:hypothetical protein
LPTSLNLLFVILSIDYDRNGHSKGGPYFIEKFQILAPNWHRAERKENAQWAFLAKESDCRGGKKPVNHKLSVVLSP